MQGFPRAWRRPARTPPSTFLFLPIHLSNSPGPEGPRSPEAGRGRNSSLPTEIGRHVRVSNRVSVRSFAGAQRCRGEPRTVKGLYRPRACMLSTLSPRRASGNFMRASHAAAHQELHPAGHQRCRGPSLKTTMRQALLHMVACKRVASARVVAPHYSHIPATFLHAGICEDARPKSAAPFAC